MSTAEKNLSSFNDANLPDASSMRIGIVVSEWNLSITSNLLKGAKELLEQAGIQEENLHIHWVPGSFELPSAAAMLLEHIEDLDGMITLGSVIRGETAHFDYVCQGVALGVKDVSLKYLKPVIFGVLTDDTKDQAEARSGGKHGNKGIEAAVTCVQMVALRNKLIADKQKPSA